MIVHAYAEAYNPFSLVSRSPPEIFISQVKESMIIVP
jgi:hypothetical protein